MQDLASEFSEIFRGWYPRTLTAGGGDPSPHQTPSPAFGWARGTAPQCWDANLGPLNFSAVVAPLGTGRRRLWSAVIASATATALAASSSASRVQDRRARASIARWCCDRVSCWWLSSSVWRWSSSAEVSFQRHPEAARATNTQQTWRQEFLGSRSSTVERPSTRTAAAGTFLRFFQTIFENTPLWWLKRLVTLSTYRRYINECIYLSTPARPAGGASVLPRSVATAKGE